ncbi:hypothetical protein [Halomonas salipaludis]|uniref:Uncharacterized protein n=1 Tax=Halomonas salipaludis TaxID=2032625 RepID=A0A2A2EQ92_9GAMM|nr:hypothetical protein [Halomonas salipaludis]PAU74569.1 hypothetical protein CK498_22365 [Halomonas salipaludis]
MKIKHSICTGIALLALFVTTAAQAEEPLAEAELSSGLAIAQVTEASRADGVLTVRVGFVAPEGARNTTQSERETIYGSVSRNVYRQDLYIIAGENRHLLLADTEGTPLTVRTLQITRDGDRVSGTWWGKFPAPEEDIESFSLALPGGMLFDNVPISDE